MAKTSFILGVLIGGLVSGAVVERFRRPVVNTRTPLEMTADRLRSETRISVSFDNIPLRESLAELSKQAGAALELDETACAAAGIPLDTPVTLTVNKAALSDVLACMTVTPAGPGLRLYWPNETSFGHEQRFRVGPMGMVLYYEIEIRAYDLMPLRERFAARRPGEALNERDMVGFIELTISDSIDSRTWQDNGGGIGSMAEFNGTLVIRQTKENHRRIAELLERLP